MATLTIRDLDEGLKQRLRIRAAHRNRSMEEEVRQILQTALAESPEPGNDLAQRIRARFSGLGDVVLALPEREPARAGADLGALSTQARPATPRRRPR